MIPRSQWTGGFFCGAHPKQKDQPSTITVIARADRPVAIRNPCGATRRPSPEGDGEMRIATGLTPLAMTVVVVTWSHFAGGAAVSDGVYRGTVITVPYGFDSHRRPGGDDRSANAEGPTTIPTVIASRRRGNLHRRSRMREKAD